MAKHAFLLALLLGSCLVHADSSTEPDADGYTRPLEQLKFSHGDDQIDDSLYDTLDIYDPWVSVNRRIYNFNYYADQYVMLPVVRGYKYVTPEVALSGVSHFFDNIGDIGNLFNSVLQLQGDQAMRTTARPLFNTPIGVFGLWDPASKMGLRREAEDFGQTLGHYGVSDGPYIVLPLLGPSNLRDTSGRVVDSVTESAINYLNVPEQTSEHPELFALKMVNDRYTTPFEYGQLSSPFEYVKVRYLYTQMRKLKIEAGQDAPNPD